MPPWLQLVLAVVGATLGSSGFWAYMQHKDVKKDATARLMMGLAYDRVTTLGIAYIDRGHITREEFEEYQKYFYEPYKALGGNGVAERIWYEVARLPFRQHPKFDEIFQNPERFIPDVSVVSQQRVER